MRLSAFTLSSVLLIVLAAPSPAQDQDQGPLDARDLLSTPAVDASGQPVADVVDGVVSKDDRLTTLFVASEGIRDLVVIPLRDSGLTYPMTLDPTAFGGGRKVKREAIRSAVPGGASLLTDLLDSPVRRAGRIVADVETLILDADGAVAAIVASRPDVIGLPADHHVLSPDEWERSDADVSAFDLTTRLEDSQTVSSSDPNLATTAVALVRGRIHGDLPGASEDRGDRVRLGWPQNKILFRLTTVTGSPLAGRAKSRSGNASDGDAAVPTPLLRGVRVGVNPSGETGAFIDYDPELRLAGSIPMAPAYFELKLDGDGHVASFNRKLGKRYRSDVKRSVVLRHAALLLGCGIRNRALVLGRSYTLAPNDDTELVSGLDLSARYLGRYGNEYVFNLSTPAGRITGEIAFSTSDGLPTRGRLEDATLGRRSLTIERTRKKR